MNVAIMQPYLFPYLGYFQLIQAVDIFVFLDDVNYIKRGYINRNQILLNGQPHRFTKPVNQLSQNRFINQHHYAQDAKLPETLAHAYQSAPHSGDVMPWLTAILAAEENVATLNARAVQAVFDYLNIKQSFLFSSAIDHNPALRGQDKIIALCRALGALTYINAAGGRALYDKQVFDHNGIDLKFIKPGIHPYPQLADEFVPHLSVIDTLMMNPVPTVTQQLNDYELGV